ncbi:piggyBac transposable element-derived protein 3 [Biomphalaria glabrata]|nr:piggyBac transposable element-derived protein 3-like [Biomphalaria glabrata]KAI8792109.1 piggyBac transposable element-derived protein 3 [Biomphalaria glabrata]
MSASLPKKFTAQEVLDILEVIDYNESDLENYSTDDEDYEPEPDKETGTQDLSSSESSSDEEVTEPLPSTSSASAINKKKKVYEWTKDNFNPPDSVFRGKVLELPENYEVQSPMHYFKNFLTDDMLELIVKFTNEYSVEKSGKSIDTNKKEIEQIIGMFLRMGLAKMPGVKGYWETDTRYDPVAGVMSRNRFQSLLSNLHFVNNNLATNEEKSDKLWKIRPWLKLFRNNCLKVIAHENNSIDEMMIPFKGKFSKLKQFIKGKPHPWGIKVWARTSSAGMLCDFDVYQGKKDKKDADSIGVGPDVVLQLSSTLPQNEPDKPSLNYKIFADNFFTTLPLLEDLQKKGIHYTGTVRPNRLPGILLDSEKNMKKKGRGTMDQCVEKSTNIVAVRWYDTKAVNMLSTLSGVEPSKTVNRFEKAKSAYVQVQQPAVIKLYNESMGGVDLHNCFIAKHSFHIRSKRWYLNIFWQTIRMMFVNAWLSYRQACQLIGMSKKIVLNQRNFQTKLASLLINLHAHTQKKRGRPSLEGATAGPSRKKSALRPMPEPEVRTDGFFHFPIKTEDRQRCKLCSMKTKNICEKCKVYLCYTEQRNCFRSFHVS